MSEVKNAKDVLVASLFELSKAAQDAASATVEFYKTIALGDEDIKLVNNLKSIQASTSSTFTEVAKSLGTAGKTAAASKSRKRKEKSKDDEKETGADANGSSTDAANAAEAEDSTTPDKKKRKKAIKDPNAPKKPLTMYFAYSFHHRDLIRKERKKKNLAVLPANELNEIVKKQWESISDSEKLEWQSKYQKELEEYKIKKDAYNAQKAATEATEASESAAVAAATAVAAAAATAVESASEAAPVKNEKKKKTKKAASTEDGEKEKEKKKKKKSEK